MKAEEFYNEHYNPIDFNTSESLEWIHSPEAMVYIAEQFAAQELKELKEKNKQANKFIKDMAEAIGMDLDGQITISIKNVEKHLADMGWVVKQSN